MSKPTGRMKFGTFISPVHSSRKSPTLALQRDVELIEHMDRLGFDEAWMGEHHSTGWEFVASPDVFLSYVAARTTRIKLGAGDARPPFTWPHHVGCRARRTSI